MTFARNRTPSKPALCALTLLWLLVALPTKGNAQQSHQDPSHRVLELPGDARMDIGQQIQTMLGLSKFVEQKEQTQSLINGLDPDQLQALGELFNLLPQQNGANGFDADALVNQLETDAEFRRSAQQMLEQFSRDRRIPAFPPGGKSPFPWLPPNNWLNGGSNTGSDPQSTDQRNGNERLADASRLRHGESASKMDRRAQEALLREVARRLGQRDPTASSPTMSEFWQQARQDPSALPDLSSLDLPELPRSPAQLAGEGSSPLDPSGNTSDYRQMRDALNNLKGVMPAQIEQRLESNGVAKTLKEMMRQAKNEVRWQPADKLPSQTVGGAAGEETQLFSGWESAIVKAVAEGATEISEIAKDLKEKARQPETGRVANAAPKSTIPSGSASSDNAISSSDPNWKSRTGEKASKPAGGFLSNLTKPPEPSSPGSPKTDAGSGGVLSGMTVPFELLAAAVFLATVGLYFFFSGQPQRKAEQELALEAIRGMEIRSRQDVIRAFHALTHRSLAASHNWWTHRRAASTLGTQRPNWQLALDHLADIYEQARYLPNDTALTEEQLRAAQRAWEHCNA